MVLAPAFVLYAASAVKPSFWLVGHAAPHVDRETFILLEQITIQCFRIRKERKPPEKSGGHPVILYVLSIKVNATGPLPTTKDLKESPAQSFHPRAC